MVHVDEVARLGASVQGEHLVCCEFVAVENAPVLGVSELSHSVVPRKIEFGRLGTVADLEAHEAWARANDFDVEAFGAQCLLGYRRDAVNGLAVLGEVVEIACHAIADVPGDQRGASGECEFVGVGQCIDDGGHALLERAERHRYVCETRRRCSQGSQAARTYAGRNRSSQTSTRVLARTKRRTSSAVPSRSTCS